jgi:glycosyltransferase involved in cell wall biosynthesis
MIIAHVLSSFGLGGQERMALALAEAQLSAGHQVIAISLSGDALEPLGAEFQSAGALIQRVAKRGAGFDWDLPLRLGWVLRRHRVEIVHTHNPQPLIYGAPASRLASAALIHTKHGKNPVPSRRRWLIRGAASLAHAYVAVAPTTARVATINRECSPEKLRVIPNGIDPERFRRDSGARAEVRQQLGIPEDAFVVGTVGRLAPEKDQDLLIRAALPLLNEHCRLILVGDGPERAALEQRASSSDNGRFVHFAGARNDPERWLSSFDVFALTSRTEGLPLVIPEAMAAECAIVSSSVGGIPDVIEQDSTGVLFQSGDEAALVGLLRAFQSDPERVRRLGERGKQVAIERYSRDRMAAEYMGLYRSALAKRSPAGALEPERGAA